MAATHSTDVTIARVTCVFAASYTQVLSLSAVIPLIVFNTLERSISTRQICGCIHVFSEVERMNGIHKTAELRGMLVELVRTLFPCIDISS